MGDDWAGEVGGVGLAWSDDGAGGVHVSSADWAGPSVWVWSQAGWAAWWWWWRSSNDDWPDDLNWLDDLDWDGSESGDLSISLSFDPLESVVLHDQEGDLGHRLGEDVLAVDVDAVVVGGHWSGHWGGDVLFLFNNSDDLSWHVVDLRSALDDSSSSTEVETIRDDVGAVSSPAVLVQVGLVKLIVGLVQVVVRSWWLASSLLSVSPSWVNVCWIVAGWAVEGLGLSTVKWVSSLSVHWIFID